MMQRNVVRSGSASHLTRSLVLLTALAALPGLTGCGKSSSAPVSMDRSSGGGGGTSATVAAAAASAGDAPTTAGLAQNRTPGPARMFEVTAELDAVVADGKARDALVQKLSRETAAAGGYVGQSELSGTTTTMVLRVPPSELERFERMLGDTGKISRRTVRSVDVTEAILDTEARLRAARAEEDRLLKLLSDKTGSLTDVLAVERSLSDVRTRIEQMEAQERGQKSRVALATLTLRLSAEATMAQEEGFGARVKDAASDGAVAVKTIAETFVLVSLRAGPTLLILSLFVLGLVRGIRFALRKRAVKAAA